MLILESAAATVLVAGSVFILRACWRIDQPKMRLARTRRGKPRGRSGPLPVLHKRAA